jgi:hypothetical protein
VQLAHFKHNFIQTRIGAALGGARHFRDEASRRGYDAAMNATPMLRAA